MGRIAVGTLAVGLLAVTGVHSSRPATPEANRELRAHGKSATETTSTSITTTVCPIRAPNASPHPLPLSKRREFSVQTAVPCYALFFFAHYQSPHIILYTVDDMGWNDMGYTSTDLPEGTPYMSKLARQGIKLTHYYSQPSCTPSRVTMMTGKYIHKNGFQNYELQVSDSIGLPLSNKIMPEHLSELGYSTLMLGKWNIGHCNSKYLPHERGFDHFIGYMCPGHGYSDHTCGMGSEVLDMMEGWAISDATTGEKTYKWATGKQYKGTYDTLLYRDEAVNSIMKHAKANVAASGDANSVPLFLWSAQHGIHGEWDSGPEPPEDLLTADNKAYLKVLEKRMSGDTTTSTEKKFFKMRKITASVLMSIDNGLKSVVETLETNGMLANSVIFVHSDNGGDTVYTKGHPGNNYPMRSEKFSYMEGGIRVPAFVFAPSLIATDKVGTSFHGLMHHVDLLPTFYGLGGGDTAALATSDDYDGMDMWAAITGETTGLRTELVLNLPRSRTWKVGETQTQEGVALRVGNYKLLLNHVVDSWFSPNAGADHHGAYSMMSSICKYSFYTLDENAGNCVYTNFLFDLSSDPHERTNLWDDAEYDSVRTALISRAEDLCAAQPNDYGSIVYEYWAKPPLDPTRSFVGNDYYAVPWECDTIA